MKSTRRPQQIGLRTLLAAIAVGSVWFGWVETVIMQLEDAQRREAERAVALRLQEGPPPAVVFSTR